MFGYQRYWSSAFGSFPVELWECSALGGSLATRPIALSDFLRSTTMSIASDLEKSFCDLDITRRLQQRGLKKGQYLVEHKGEERVVDPKWYHIRRINGPQPSPLRKLFHIKVTPEWTLMACKLKEILVL